MIYMSYPTPNPDNYSMKNFSDDDNLDNFSDQTRLDYIDYVQALQVCESLLIIDTLWSSHRGLNVSTEKENTLLS